MLESESVPTKWLVKVTAVGLIAGFVGAALFTGLAGPGGRMIGTIDRKVTEERHYLEESDSIEAIQKVVPAVISIVATKDLQVFQQQPIFPFMFPNDPFFNFGLPQQQQQQGQAQPETQRQKVSGGTGFIVESDGLAVTNKHVVADTKADYTALTKDGTVYDVEIIGRDTVNDLAVIQLHKHVEDEKDRKTGDEKKFGDKPKNMPILNIGDSSKLKVGQRVLAVGNARGEYENSVTSGIVSATDREIHAQQQGGGAQATLSGLIQTDAAINFGNSGGPLVNLGGEVIGVNTAVDASANGIGFAIPANQIKPVIESVKKFGRIVRPVLGVQHILLTAEKAKELKLEGLEYGALVSGDRAKKDFGVVAGSPAEKAGLKLDDVILEVDGEKITTENPLSGVVQRHAPGETLKLKVWRAGNTFELSVTLDERKEEAATK